MRKYNKIWNYSLTDLNIILLSEAQQNAFITTLIIIRFMNIYIYMYT